MPRTYIVVIDPGHGGDDPGAVGVGGLREADVNLSVSSILTTLLDGSVEAASGSRVRALQTRSGNSTVSLAERVLFAGAVAADLLVSVHANAAESPMAEGFEVWTSPGRSEADRLADQIIGAWNRAFPGARLRLDQTDGDGDKEAGFWVLTKTACPAVLVELGFVTHAGEALVLSDGIWQKEMAKALAEGVRRHLFGPDEEMLRRAAGMALAAAADDLPAPRTTKMSEKQQGRLKRFLLILGRVINRGKETGP